MAQCIYGAEQLKVDMECAINDYQDEFGQAIAMATTENGPMFPKEEINPIRERILGRLCCISLVNYPRPMDDASLRLNSSRAAIKQKNVHWGKHKKMRR
jgi:hypothetical protein